MLYKTALVYKHFPAAIVAPLNEWILPIGCVHPWAAVARYTVEVKTQSNWVVIAENCSFNIFLPIIFIPFLYH